MFALKHRELLPTGVVDEFENLTASLKANILAEHNEDGTHGDVVADSLTLGGASMGEWINIPYDSARYVSGGSGTWTVDEADQLILRYTRIRDIAIVHFALQNTVISTDTPTDGLLIKFPELHVVPLRDTLGNVYPSGTGRVKYNNITEAVSGNCDCDIYASNLADVVPSTIFEMYGMTVTFASLPVTIRFAGTLTFALEKDNVAVPYYGS